jgi:hypothetical protein
VVVSVLLYLFIACRYLLCVYYSRLRVIVFLYVTILQSQSARTIAMFDTTTSVWPSADSRSSFHWNNNQMCVRSRFRGRCHISGNPLQKVKSSQLSNKDCKKRILPLRRVEPRILTAQKESAKGINPPKPYSHQEGSCGRQPCFRHLELEGMLVLLCM